MEKRKLILLLLICLFFFTVFTQVFFSEKPERVKKLTYTGGKKEIGKEAKHKKIDKLFLSKIKRSASNDPEIKRNLFSFLNESSTYEVKKTEILKTIEEKIEEKETIEKKSFLDDMNKYKFFGFFKKNDNYILFLSRDDEISLTKAGQKINDKYEIQNFLEDKLTLFCKETGEEVELNLEEDFAKDFTSLINGMNNGKTEKNQGLKKTDLLYLKDMLEDKLQLKK
jgi:hypothetical protein